ncbi:MAG: alcohol dehydrogenase catalytic domain-containing protein [Bacteroidota bacterium]
MKSMVLTGPGQMSMTERPMPVVEKDTDVLIRMKTVGVCGSDIHYYIHGKIGSQVVQYPFIVGHEGAGEVVSIGPGVTRVAPGQRIAIDPAMPCFACDQCLEGRPHTCRNLKFLGCPGQAEGCLSEYIVMPETSCYPIPDSMSHDEAAISEPMAIGVYAVRIAGIPMKGKKIGVLGFGPIGMSVLLAAREQGAEKAYVTDRIDARLATARLTGASLTGNPDRDDIVAMIKADEPRLLDVIFECCGKQEAVNHAIELLRPGGKLMVIGIPEFSHWSFPVDELRRKEITIQNVRRQNECVRDTLDLMASHRIDVSRMPTHWFPFERSKEAFDLVAGYQDGVMKAMIEFEKS